MERVYTNNLSEMDKREDQAWHAIRSQVHEQQQMQKGYTSTP